MKSIKKTMQYGAFAVICGVVTYQAFAGLLNIGGQDDRGSAISVLGSGTEDESGSVVRVGGLKVLSGEGEVVGFEGKKSRVCEKGRADARHNRTKSYFRGSNQAEYDRCKADEQARMKQEGKKPSRRSRSTTESRRTKRVRTEEVEQ